MFQTSIRIKDFCKNDVDSIFVLLEGTKAIPIEPPSQEFVKLCEEQERKSPSRIPDVILPPSCQTQEWQSWLRLSPSQQAKTSEPRPSKKIESHGDRAWESLSFTERKEKHGNDWSKEVKLKTWDELSTLEFVSGMGRILLDIGMRYRPKRRRRGLGLIGARM